MSDAYEKALEAVHKENEKRIGRLDIRTVVEIYLAALPPSIVVDGKVADVDAVMYLVSARAHVSFSEITDEAIKRNAEAWGGDLLDAAREVADE